MPQPAGDNIRSHSTNPTWVQTHRPECVSAIGLVALAWTRVENQLATAISGSVGAARIGYGGTLDWIVHNIMGEAETIRVRLKIVNSILDRMLGNTELLVEWKDIEKALSKRARERNVVVHSDWAWSEDAPDKILRVEKGGAITLWVEQDFIDVFERIKHIEHRLHEFMTKVWLEVQTGRVKI